MTTQIKTARATYTVERVELVRGKLYIVGRTAKGTQRSLSKRDVTTARWYAALGDWARRQREARRVP